jgi:curved DNA-binding protein CbpA
MADRDAYEILQVHPKADVLIIQAAYRILAAKYHPDRDSSPGADRRMAEINAAFELIRTEDRRLLYDKQRALGRATVTIVTPPYSAPQPTRPSAEAASPDVIDFGRYAGWKLDQVVKQDPEYLEWLARHSSGIRYRRRIQELLQKQKAAAAAAAEKRKEW